jgi:hypothetical protein
MNSLSRLLASGALCVVAAGAALADEQNQQKASPQQQEELRAFEARYALPEGAALKRIAPPFIAERATFVRLLLQGASNTSAPSATALFLQWRDHKLVARPAVLFHVQDPFLGDALESLTGLMPPEVEAEASLLEVHVSGDFVVRADETDERIVASLEPILRDELKLPVRMTFRREKQPVIVASGMFEFAALPEYPKAIQIYSADKDLKGPSAAGRGDVEKLLQNVGRRIGKRIVNELEISPDQDFEWTVRGGGRDPTADTVAHASWLLDNLSKQTGMKFFEAEREVRILTVKRD